MSGPLDAPCDRELWVGLKRIVESKGRQVAALESAGLLPAVFASERLNFSGVPKCERKTVRREWHSRAMGTLYGCDIVFADPDNGLIVPSADDTPRSNQYVLPAELADYYRSGASVVYYQHKARKTDESYFSQLCALAASGAFPAAVPMGLKFRTTSQRFYFFLLQPDHAEKIGKCVSNMLERKWSRHFESCTLA